MKVTIIATDNIGREESISLILDEKSPTVGRLKRASDNNDIRGELNYMEEKTYYSRYSVFCYPYFSKSQLRRLNEFDDLIYNKFYNYTLSLQFK